MKTCPHCHIQVGGDTGYCPLCQNRLHGEQGSPWFRPRHRASTAPACFIRSLLLLCLP